MAGLFGDILGFSSAGRAAKSVSDSNIAAENGVLGATASGQQGIQTTLAQNGNALTDRLNGATDAINNAGDNVYSAANGANSTLAQLYNTQQGQLAPAIQSGVQGNQGLQDYAKSNPQFSFDPSKYINSDAYNFQLKAGTDATTNAASAMGLNQSGKNLTDLTQYGQGLASTYYNNAFNQAQSEFQTNQNTTLSNLQALIGSGNSANTLSQANSNFTGQQMSNNLTGAANTNAGLQTNLAGLTVGATGTNNGQNLQGATASGQLGLEGATTAGNFAVGAGAAHGAGIIGQGAALTGAASDLAGLFTPGGTSSLIQYGG